MSAGGYNVSRMTGLLSSRKDAPLTRRLCSTVCLLWLATGLAAAQGSMEWKGMANLNLAIDGGRDASARFFITQDQSLIMAVSQTMGQVFVIVPKNGSYGVMGLNEVAIDPFNNVAATAAKPPIVLQGSIRAEASDIVFDFQGATLRVARRPPLVGQTPVKKLFEHSPDYRELADAYVPNRQVLAFLSKFNRKVEVRVGFGVWCAHCKKIVPKVIRTLQLADNANIEASYIGLDQTLTQPAEFVAGANIGTVPTVLVYHEGRELGRISGDPQRTVEADLAAIFMKAFQQ